MFDLTRTGTYIYFSWRDVPSGTELASQLVLKARTLFLFLELSHCCILYLQHVEKISPSIFSISVVLTVVAKRASCGRLTECMKV